MSQPMETTAPRSSEQQAAVVAPLMRPRLTAEELAAADRAREYWASRRTPVPADIANADHPRLPVQPTASAGP